MKFSYEAVWDDALAMLRANASLLIALAGAFFLLPTLFVAFLAPSPEGAVNVNQMVDDLWRYYSENWPWMLLANLVNMVGAITILLLLFNVGRLTVGSALSASLPILPSYFLLSIVTGIIIGFGFIWLIVPGIYLLGRVMIANAAMVAESRRDPFASVGRAWQLTRGRGWSIGFLIVLVSIVAQVVTMAITFVIGGVLYLIGGREGIGGLLTILLTAILSSGVSVLLVALYAAIYRALAPADASASAAVAVD